MGYVDKSRLRSVDTSDWAERPKLFVDTFGGWDVLEYICWLNRMADKYHDERRTKRDIDGGRSIRDQDDFTEFLRREYLK